MNASAGDGLDSNGSIDMSAGTVIVHGPQSLKPFTFAPREPLLQIDVVRKKCGLAAAGLGSHHIWEVRRYLMHLIQYIIYIAELGNTP